MANRSTPQFHCTDGVLHISAPWSDIRIQWRPFIRAQEKDRSPRRRWKEFWPEFRILRPATDIARRPDDDIEPALLHEDEEESIADAKMAAFAGFRKEIPERFASVVEPFGSHQWALLKLLREEKTFRDLAKANATLAYCLANNGEFRGTDAKIGARLAVAHSHAKQREILQWLGFPGTPAMVKLLKKVRAAAVSPFAMRCLRAATQRDEVAMQLLSHQKCIGAGILALACNRHTCDLVTPKLISEVAASGEEETVSPTADCLGHAVQLLHEIGNGQSPPPFRSRRRIRQFHDEIADEYETHKERVAVAHQERLRKKYAFQSPPIPGTDKIVPVVSSIELKQEGKSQGNCVGSYEKSVRSGKTYIYRILAPGRATLSIVQASDGCWRRSELKAKSNRAVSHQTAAAVDRWLYENSLSA